MLWSGLGHLNEAGDLVFPHVFAYPASEAAKLWGCMKRSLIAHDSGGWHFTQSPRLGGRFPPVLSK